VYTDAPKAGIASCPFPKPLEDAQMINSGTCYKESGKKKCLLKKY